MSQILKLTVDAELSERLEESARGNGRSLEAEVRERLRDSLGGPRELVPSEIVEEHQVTASDDQPGREPGLGSQIIALFSGQGIGFDEEDIARMEAFRNEPMPPLTFG